MRLLPSFCRASSRCAWFASLLAAAFSLFAPSLRAQWIGATTGTTNDATHDYNNTTNWTGGTITDSFSGPTFTDETTLYLTANRVTGAGGLDLQFANLTRVFRLSSNGTSGRVLTLGGNIAKTGQASVFIGDAVVAANGVAIDLGGATRTLSVGEGGLELHNVVSNGGIVKTGAGWLTLYGTNTFTGDLVINAGSVSISSSGSVAGNIVNNVAGIGGLAFSSPSAITASTVISGAGGVIINRSMTFTAAQLYTGATNVYFQTLFAGQNGAFAAFSPVYLQVGVPTSILDINGTTQTIGGLSGGGMVTNSAGSSGSLTVNQSNTTNFSGTVTKGTGGLTFIKSGTGSLTLDGAVTHDVGTVTVTGGTLALSNAGGALSNSNVTVNNPTAGTTANFNLSAGSFSGSLNLESGDATAISAATISGTGQFTTSLSSLIGSNAGSNAQVTLTGASARWTVNGDFETRVGGAGTGALTINSGAQMTAGSINVGQTAGGTGTLTIAGAGTTVTASSSNNSTGVVIGAGTGTGTLNLTTGAVFNSGTGGITILNLAPSPGSTGTLNIGNGAAPGTLNAAAVGLGAGTATLAFNHTDTSGTYVFAAPIAGTNGTVSFAGSGGSIDVTTLTGANTFTGTTTVSSLAKMQIGNGGTTGSWTGNITNNFILSFNRSDAYTYAGAISGSGATYKEGAGTLTLSGTSTFGDGIQLNGGTLLITGVVNSAGFSTNVAAGTTLQIGNGGTTGTHNGFIRNFSSVVFNRSDAVTFSDLIVNTGSVTQAGTGTLTLTAANTYTGATTVSAGTLRLNGSTAAASTVTIASGATLGGTGTIGGSVTAQLGGRMAPGASIGTLTVNGDITWNGSTDGSATMLFELSNTDTTSDHILTLGNFSKGTGSTFKFDFSNSGTPGTTYALIQHDGTTFVASDFSATNLPSGLAASFAVTSTFVRVTLIATNEAPVVTTSGGATAYTENGAALAIDPSLTVTDSDSANLTGAIVRLTTVAFPEDTLAFTSANGITGSYLSGQLTLSGSSSVANYEAALRSVTYVNSSENPSTATRTISFVVNDGTASSVAATNSVTVTAVNDAPVVTAPATIAVTEDTAVAVTGISFSDADAGTASVAATLSAPSGTFTTGIGGGVSASLGASTVTLTGTITAINTHLASGFLSYTPAANVNGNLTLTTTLNDGGNTGSGGARTGTGTTTLVIAAVNDAPSLSGAPVIAVDEDVPTALSLISVADVDAGSASVTVTASVPSGTLAATSGGGVIVGGTATARTFAGTIANLNAYFAAGNVTFTTALNSGTGLMLSLGIDDGGNTGSGGAQTGTRGVVLNVGSVNDAPVNTLPPAQSTLQNTPLALTGATKLSFADVDLGGDSTLVTLTATNGTFSLSGITGLTFTTGDGTADATMTFTGLITAINTALDGLVFTPTAGFSGAASLRIVSNDQGNTGSGGAQSDDDTLAISVGGVPVIVTSGGATAYTENAAPLVIDAALTITDTDSPTLASATVSITGNFQTAEDVLAFSAVPASMGNITGSYATGVLTLTSAGATATLAHWQAALRSVTYANSSDAPNTGDRTITLIANDGANPGGAATKLVAVAVVNDAPVATAPANLAGTEDTLLALTGISFSDADAGASPITVTLSAPSGTFTTGIGGGVSAVIGASTVTLTGTIAAINAHLAGSNVAYRPAANVNGNLTLTTTIDDGGNTGSGGAKTGSATTTLALAAVNDAPTVTAPATIAVDEDVPLALTGITFADVDAVGPSVSISFSVASGALTGSGGNILVGPNINGVSAAAGSGTSSRVLTGPISLINSYLAGGHLLYTSAANASGNVNLSITINDGGNTGSGGAQTGNANVTLAVAAVNDAPVHTLPPSQSTLQNTPLTLTGATKISLADVDAVASAVQVALTATNGTFSLGGTTGLAFTAGDGTADAAMTFTGTIAATNTALDGLVFTPTAAFAGTATLQIVTNDQGSTGSGGAQTDTDTLTIAVGGVPVVATSGGATAWIEADPVAVVTVVVDAALTVSDSNSATLPSGTVAITGGFVAAEDTLAFTAVPASMGNLTGSYASGTGILTLTSAGNTATLAQWQAALRAVAYTNSSATPTATARTISFTVTDGTNTSAVGTKSVTVTATNNAPINTIPAALTTQRDVSLTLSGATKLSIADIDAGTDPVQARITVTNGTVKLTGPGPATNIFTSSGPIDDLNARLDGMVFAPTPGFVGTATIQLLTSDLGHTGSGGDKTDTDTLTITVTAPPPPPPPPPAPVILAQTVTFDPVSVQIGSSVTLSATASSGLPVTFSLVTGNGTLNGTTFTPADLSPVTLRATQSGNGTYSSAFAERTFTATGKFAQTITFAAPTDRPANSPAFTLNATASSGLAVGYAIVSGPAMLSGNTITLTGAPGTVVITASQSGSTTFEAATAVTRSFNVTPIAVFVFFGATNAGDDVAATLTLDRTSGRAIGYLRATGESFVLPFKPASAPGTYTGRGTLFSSTALPHPFTATLRASANGDVLTGSVDGNPLTFSITIQSQVGPNAAVAGGYHAPLVNHASGETHAVASAPGRVYFISASPGLTGGGFGTLDSGHTFSVTTTPTSTVAGAIDPASTIVTGIYTPPGKAASAFAGLNIATLRTDRLVNLSSRDRVGSGPRTLIAGFVIAGDALKNVLIRATGPGLSQFGLTGTLANPSLVLYRDGRIVHDNDDWSQSPNPADISGSGARIGAFALGAASRDAAIFDSLAPGAYTAQVLDQGGTGVALAEIYDAAVNPSSEYQRLVNISSRGESSPGDGVLVGGFTITGNFPKRVLIRGIGPTLGAFGVPGTLSDPTVKIFNQIGIIVGQNDDWETPTPVSAAQSAATAAEINTAAAQSGAFALPAGAKDSTVILTLAPGAYTAHVASATGQTGVALVEIYEIPQ